MLDPTSVAYVEFDRDLGMHFAYLKKDVADKHIEPAGRDIKPTVYRQFLSLGIPTIEAFGAGKRSPLKEKRITSKPIGEITIDSSIDAETPIEHEIVVFNHVTKSQKTCKVCGKVFTRADFPNLTDINWEKKIYCNKTCSKKIKKRQQRQKKQRS